MTEIRGAGNWKNAMVAGRSLWKGEFVETGVELQAVARLKKNR
jgi:hypothetical protein